jgi:HEAT repeat protein
MLWLTLRQLKSKSLRQRQRAVRKLRRLANANAVEPLMEALGDPEPELRRAAAEALGEIRDPRAVPALVTALRDPATSVRESAVDALRQIGSRDAVSSLVEGLRESNTSVRRRVAKTLESLRWQPSSAEESTTFLVALGELERAAMLGKAAVKPLAGLLQESTSQERVLAIELLGEIGDSSSIPPLLAALRDPDPFLRRAAANALGRLRGSEAVGALISILKDPDTNVRAAAANSLGAVADSRAVAPLIRLLSEAHWQVRVEAVEALGRLKSPEALQPLLGCLRDKDKEVRAEAAHAVGEFADAGCVEALVNALVDPEAAVRQAAARALIKISPCWEQLPAASEALPNLWAAFRQKDPAVRFAAIEVLRRLGETPAVSAPLSDKREAAIQILIELLRDPDPDLRRTAIASLARVADRRVAMHLETGLSDPEGAVRQAAAAALQTLRATAQP